MSDQKKTYKCSEVGKTCKYQYRHNYGGGRCTDAICYYIGVTGHRRGCDPEHCDKYEPLNGRCRIRKPLDI